MPEAKITPDDLDAYRVDPRRAPRWMRRDLAARVFSVSARSLSRWASCGLIRASRPGVAVTLYDRDSIIAHIEGSAINGASAA